jgi:hypothetical protein
MAQEEIIFKVGVDTGDSVQDVNKVGDAIENVGKDAKKADGSFVNLRKELKQLTLELQNLDPASKEFETVAKRAGQIKEQMRGVADAINDADPEKFGGKFQRTAEGIAGAFSAVTGAQALFGQQSEEIEKQMLKVQGAIALTQGISSMKELRNDATDLFNAVKTGGVNAFKALQKAIGSTGIGLLLVALGTLVAYWDEIKAAISGVSKEQEKLNSQAQQNIKIQDLKKQSLSDQDNILKLQGKSEQDILKIKQRQTEQQIKAYEVGIANSKSTLKLQVEAEKRNQEFLKNTVRVGAEIAVVSLRALAAPFDLLIKTYNTLASKIGLKEIAFSINDEITKMTKLASSTVAKLAFDADATKAAGDKTIYEQEVILQKLRNEQAGYVLESRDIDKKAAEDKNKKDKDNGKKAVKTLEETEREKLDLKRKLEDLTVANIQDAYTRESLALKYKHERELEDLKKQYDSKKILKEDYEKMVLEIDKKQAEEKAKFEEEQKKIKDEKEIVDKNKAFEEQKASLEAEIITNAENFAIKQQKQLELENADYEQKKLNAQGNKAQLELIEAQHAANVKAINKDSVDYQKMLDETLKQSKVELLGAIGSIFGELAGLSKQASGIQKAFALTQVAIDTATAISGLTSISFSAANPANKVNPLAPYIQLAAGTAKIISNMSRVKSILGSGVNVAPPTTGGGPNSNLGIGPTQGTQTNVQAQSTYKVVVVDSDITKMQDKTKKVNAISTI